ESDRYFAVVRTVNNFLARIRDSRSRLFHGTVTSSPIAGRSAPLQTLDVSPLGAGHGHGGHVPRIPRTSAKEKMRRVHLLDAEDPPKPCSDLRRVSPEGVPF